MWNKKRFLLLFALLSFSNILLGEDVGSDASYYQLKWMEVEGASGYVLEIKNSAGYMVVSEKVNGTTYDLNNFTSGIYEHRVAVINKLGKVGTYSEWVKFEVVVSKVPTLTKDSVYSVSKEEKTKTLILEGKDFISPMNVFMITGGKKIPAKSVVVETSGIAKATFDVNPDTETGIYDLVIENPRKKAFLAKQRVVLSDSKEKADRFAKRQEKIIKKEIPEDYYETPYFSTLWRSSLVPGWGQKYIDGANWKFYTYPLLVIGAGAIYANSYNRFLSARSAYESSVVLGVFLAGDPNAQGLWIVNRANVESNFNSARQELNTIQIGAGILGVFLAYNLIDSYLSAKRNVAMDGFEIPLFEENKRLKVNVNLVRSNPNQMQTGGANSEFEFLMRF